jgi:cation diffusion facilitator family transporter
LFLLSGVVIWEALARLLGGAEHPVEATAWSFAVILGSIAVDFFRARVLYRTAAETGSEALEADALHFGSDMWSSIAVLIGLAAVAAGYLWADAAAAIAVALFICIAGWRLGRRTIGTLTDTAPAGLAEAITAIVARIPGVVAVERVRVRQAGGVPFVDLTVAVSRTLPLDRAVALRERVERGVRGRFPRAELTINTEPRALDSESVLEQVMVIARNRALAVHHVTVHAINAQLSVSLDLELDGALKLGAAHEIASELEEAIKAELGEGVEVETHIEPLQPHRELGADASAQRIAVVRDALGGIAERFAALGEVHDVRVRESDAGEIVNFHCYADPTLTVAQVHERVDDLERALRERFPSIKRVIGHAEPRRG